jgi:hypothetical protein
VTIQDASALHTKRRNDHMVIMEMRKPAGSVEGPEIRELTAAEVDQVHGGFAFFTILGAVTAITAVVVAIVAAL